MAHPTETKRRHGRLWHLEDSGLPISEARALRKHLIRTEDKKATINKSDGGYQVWWAKR